jgi:regulator of sirC expression with transglutaminase-like and TPR domain
MIGPLAPSQWGAMAEAGAREAFARLVKLPESEMDLAEGALLIAAEEYPGLRVGPYLEKIDRLAGDLRRRVRTETEPERVVEICNHFLFREQQFRGNTTDYADIRNSYLNEVLDRRTGIPVTLAAVYIAVGERAGLPVRGVGMPGHFLVRYQGSRSKEIFVDAFNGRVLDREGCAALLHETYQGQVTMRPAFLRPVLKRQILARILNNLKTAFMARGDLLRALAASDRIILADPHLTAEWRDRGMIEHQLRRDGDALRDFNKYLSLKPEPEDADRIRTLKNELLGRLN